MRTVTLKLSKDGKQVEVDVDGCQGESCKTDILDVLSKALGIAEEEERKPEFYLPEPERDRITQF